MQRSTANWFQAGLGRLQLTGAQLCLVKLRGPESAIRGHFEGRGVPGTTGYTLGAGGGAARGGRSLHLPGLVPPAGSARRGGSRTCGPRARWPPASGRLPRASCRSPWPRRATQIRTLSKVQIPNASSNRLGFSGNPTCTARLSSTSKRPAAVGKIPGQEETDDFFRKERENTGNFNPSGEGKVSLQG